MSRSFHFAEVKYGKQYNSRPSSSEIAQWCITICIIIAGLFALFFFAHMGGMSALVGPWIILAVSLLVQKIVKMK